MLKSAVSAGVMGLIAVASCAPSTKHPGYEDAIREARRNIRSGGGVRYARLARRHVGKDLREVARLCQLRIPDKRGVTILYRLDTSGDPLETIVYPDEELGACMREGLDFFPLPPPPEADYWLGLSVPASSNPPTIWGGG
jgi:hypothetical protein